MILLTGASGFLGGVIRKELLQFDILTLGRASDSKIECDLSKDIPNLSSFSIDIVVHAAGKAHVVPKTEFDRQEFHKVNVIGTENLLKSLEQLVTLPKAFVFISSVAVYGLESGISISEDAPLVAKDPYGKSKIDAEYLISTWCLKNNVTCSILRLPLISGPNPPGNLGTMISGIKRGYYFNIAKGKARKSIVCAEDVAKIIPTAAEVGGVYNLTDGYHPTFYEISSRIAKELNKPEPLSLPVWFTFFIAKAGDFLGSKFPINSNKLSKITSDLTFDDLKARVNLKWKPESVLKNIIK